MTTMKTALLALGLAALSAASAQQVQIDGVRPKEFRGVNPIKGKGYYTYYVNEKSGKGMIDFALEIYDQDLNVIKKTNIEVTKNSEVVGSEFNGNDFLFVFTDLSKKTNTFVTVDSQGNIIKQKTEPEKKMATAGSAAVYPSMDGNGFYMTHAVKEKKWGYEVVKYDRDLKELWSKTVTVEKGMVGVASAESGPGKLVVISMERPGMMSKKIYGKVVCFNGETGDKEWEHELYDGKQTNLPSSFLIEPDGSVATAGMYYDGEKMSGDNSDGIFFLKLDASGKQTAYKSIDWDNGIQEALKATSRKFSIGSKPKVIFHEIIKEGSGNYQVIAETFRKAIGALGMLAMAGGNSNVPMRFTVMDYIIFNFDSKGEPMDINKIEKPYKTIEVDGTIANADGITLATYLKKYKMFTYEYQTKLQNGKQAIVFTNFEDAGLGTGKPYVGVATIDIGKDSEMQKIPMPKKYTSFVTSNPENLRAGTMEGKPGKFCMFVYDKKAKAIMMSIEEITSGQ
ncbi:MAG: hypothetical protein KA791_12335 [Flavobacteriales bacterium]|nr:hypothetical protein [Flavobacteriales bacterium]